MIVIGTPPPAGCSPVLLPKQDLDGVEVGSVSRFFTPAALHQDSQLFTVTL